MKRKFKQEWSTIPSISTKRTITSHINSLNIQKNDQIWHVGNPGNDLYRLEW